MNGFGRRSREFETDFLDGAARLVGASPSYAGDVRERLAVAERTYGVESYLDKTMGELLTELDEEGLDCGGWGVLAALKAQALELDDEERMYAVLALQRIAAIGAQVGQEIKQLRDRLEDQLRA